MEVRFRTNSLRDCYASTKKATLAWGSTIGRLYIRRVNALYTARDHRTLGALAQLRFHALSGDRKGQYAIVLDKAWRLIVTFGNDQFTIVTVEEVTDHHGD